jgi:hypothetical protein
MQKITRLFLAALFGSIIFITRIFVPPPIDQLLIMVDAVLLALSALFIKKLGATYAAAIGGVLLALWRPTLLPYSLIFTLLYGVIVDAFFFVFKVKAAAEGVNRNKLILAMAVSTLIIAFTSYYATTNGIQIIQGSQMLDMMVLFFGPVSGAVAGYAAAYLWNKYLKSMAVTL